MDIKNIKPSADAVFTLEAKDEAGRAQTVRITVNYLTVDEVGDFFVPGRPFRFSLAARQMLMDATVGWDLTENGKPVECNDAEKQRLMPWLLGSMLEDDRPAPDRVDKDGNKIPHPNPLSLVLGRALLVFAADERNFLKN